MTQLVTMLDVIDSSTGNIDIDQSGHSIARTVDPTALGGKPRLGSSAAAREKYWKAPEHVRNVETLGPNSFRVAVRDLETFWVAQPTPDTCWAACVAMVSGATRMGKEMADPQFVAAKYRTNEGAQTGGLLDVVTALAPESTTRFGSYALARNLPEFRPGEWVQRVAEGHVGIVGLTFEGTQTGHMCVVSALRFSRLDRKPGVVGQLFGGVIGGKDAAPDTSFDDNPDAWAIDAVELLDPDPNTRRRELTGEQAARMIDFVVTRESIRLAEFAAAGRR